MNMILWAVSNKKSKNNQEIGLYLLFCKAGQKKVDLPDCFMHLILNFEIFLSFLL